MCGIFGYLGPKSEQIDSESIVKALYHRGPDDQGVRIWDDGVFVQTRLSIIDVDSQCKFPLATPDGKVTIVFNGEIYNYQELRRQTSDYPFQTETDTEVILAAYQKWGIDCLQKLRGMFAFVIRDETQGRVFGAIDRFSIKPVYYTLSEGELAFSSELKVFETAGYQLRPNFKLIYDYLEKGLMNHCEETWFENIYQLRPAQYFLYDQNGFSINKYWDLDPEAVDEFSESKTRRLVESIDDEFDTVIDYHLKSDMEVGLSLSSGLDSNIILDYLIEKIYRAKLKCFTFSYRNTIYDEEARLPSIGHHVPHIEKIITPVTNENLLEGFKQDVLHMEEPSLGAATHGSYLNYQAAKSHNIKVLLDGQGADELFAGYQHYGHKYLYQLSTTGHHDLLNETYKSFQVCHESDGASIPPLDAILTQQQNASALMTNDAKSMSSHYLSDDFVETFEQGDLEFSEPYSCLVKNAMYRDLMCTKIPRLLRYQDKISMAHSIEVRVPFLDHVFVEKIFSIPTHRLLQRGIPKYLERLWARSRKLDALFDMSKLYVSTPQREWLKEVKDSISERINSSSLHKLGLINLDKLRKQFDEFVRQPDPGNSFFIWKFLNTEYWFDQFIKS